MHLLTIIGMVLLIAIATVIVVLIGSFTYVIVKHVTGAAYKTMHPEKHVIPDTRYLDSLKEKKDEKDSKSET